VYGHLLRDGYIVRRHPVRWTLGDAETAASVWPWGTAAVAASSVCAPAGSATAKTGDSGAPPAADSGPPAAPPPPLPPRKRRRLEPAAAATAAAGGDLAANSALSLWWPALGSAAAATTWLSCVDGAFVAALPACAVEVEGEGLSLAERFPALAPLRELRPVDAPLGQAAAGGLGRPPGTAPAAATAGTLAAPCFDVFQPNGRFSRNRPDPVALRVAVCAGGALPSLWEMQALDAASPDAPVAVAVVSRGDVTFHGFTRVQLPTLFDG